MTNSLKLGTAVTYISTTGFEKLAFVLATSDTPQPEDGIPGPPEGFLHLSVFNINGKISPRYSVPSEEIASTIPDFASEGELSLRGVYRTI